MDPQLSHDFAAPPGTYSPEPEPEARELYEAFWFAMTRPMVGPYAVGEAMGLPSLTHECSGIDISFECCRGRGHEVVAMLRAAADSGEAWLEKNGPLPD